MIHLHVRKQGECSHNQLDLPTSASLQIPLFHPLLPSHLSNINFLCAITESIGVERIHFYLHHRDQGVFGTRRGYAIGASCYSLQYVNE